MNLTDDLIDFHMQTAKALRCSDRRVFMARIVKFLGKGGQRCAELK